MSTFHQISPTYSKSKFYVSKSSSKTSIEEFKGYCGILLVHFFVVAIEINSTFVLRLTAILVTVVSAVNSQLVDDFTCPDEFVGYYPHLIRSACV